MAGAVEWVGMEPVLGPRALPLQVDVDATIRALGGYWRVLSQTARLLEECGEVAEARDVDELVEECADIVIVATSIANQLGVALTDHYERVGLPHNLRVTPVERFDQGLVNLLGTAGRVARTVNALVGDKPMRPGQMIPDLGDTITSMHVHAAAIGNVGQTPFMAVIGNKLAHIRVRDAGRFKPIPARSVEPVAQREPHVRG